jgi:hypothetical protein
MGLHAIRRMKEGRQSDAIGSPNVTGGIIGRISLDDARAHDLPARYRMLKRTGTTKDKALSGALPGGLGIGWARASMASVSSSSSEDPELFTIRLLSK